MIAGVRLRAMIARMIVESFPTVTRAFALEKEEAEMTRNARQHTTIAGGRRWGVSSLLLLSLIPLPVWGAGLVKIQRISPPPLDLEVALPSGSPSMSPDGRYIAFVSTDSAWRLRFGGGEVYVRDRETGSTEWIAEGSIAVISDDGRFVAFQSDADLVPGDTNGAPDVYTRDRQTGKTELVSVGATGSPSDGWYNGSPAISGDGRFVGFVSWATNLVPGHTSDEGGVYLRDRLTGKTDWVGPTEWFDPPRPPAISGDGRFVAYYSDARNRVPGDTNDAPDVFVWDRQTGTTELVSVSTGGVPASGGAYPLSAPAISPDGRFIAFTSDSANLVHGDARSGLFLRDRLTRKTERVGDGYAPAISPDGRFIAFASYADNLVPGDTNGEADVFVRDRQTGKTERVSGDGGILWRYGGGSTAISADGRLVAFGSGADYHAVIRDRSAATAEVIAVTVNVGQTPMDCYEPAISADGQWVAFVTAGQVFERNRVTGAAALVSASPSGAPANSSSRSLSISRDGRFVVFWSDASNLSPGKTYGIYLWDRQQGTTEFVSDGWSPAISGDGHFVAFAGGDGIFVRDRELGTTELVSGSVTGETPNGLSDYPAISADGHFVALYSEATNLVSGDTNGTGDIFVWDRQTRKTELVTVAANGAPADGWSSGTPAISGTGRFVAFRSEASNLVPGSAGGGVFVRDRQTGKTEWVGESWERPAISADGRFVAFTGDGVQLRDRQTGKTERLGDGWSPAISGDGHFVAFLSDADDLVPGDMNGKRDVFVAERQ